MENSKIIAYTDGSANWVDMKGGAGAYIIDGSTEIFISKGLCNTKVGRAEIHAVLMTLQAIRNKNREVLIFSDSQYVVSSIAKGWIYKWEKINFEGKKNPDLWKQILVELRKFKHKILIKHVKGHVGIVGNEVADMLADYKQFDKRKRFDDEQKKK